MDEAERQRRLLDALRSAEAHALPVREHGGRAQRGLQAYRANAEASAERALATAFPTLQMLLGQDDFRQLAREHWREHPPARGDLGEWGTELPGWIATHPQLAAWPYLADAARLDAAVHACERAADGSLDGGSLSRLGDTDPSRLAVDFQSGVALVESPWPIVLLHRAHHGDPALLDGELPGAIAERRAEAALVARRGWKAEVHALDTAAAGFTRDLLAGRCLGDALARAGEGFDFAAWLAAALQGHWLKGIARRGD